MQTLVFADIDSAIASALEKITLYDLVNEAEKQKQSSGFMFYI
jgi:DNA-binding IscR family transcriptional regulator